MISISFLDNHSIPQIFREHLRLAGRGFEQRDHQEMLSWASYVQSQPGALGGTDKPDISSYHPET